MFVDQLNSVVMSTLNPFACGVNILSDIFEHNSSNRVILEKYLKKKC